MDYIKKLKLAKEALESGSYDRETIEYIFPELKENKDEKIRRALLEMIHDTTEDELWVDYNIKKEEALTWLEKQNEHNTTWSPTVEQIETLTHFVRSIGESGYASPYSNDTKILYSLLKDLEGLYNQDEKNTIKITNHGTKR